MQVNQFLACCVCFTFRVSPVDSSAFTQSLSCLSNNRPVTDWSACNGSRF